MSKSLQNYINEAASSPKKKPATPQVIQPKVEELEATKPSLKEYISTVSLQKPKKIEQPVSEIPVLTVVQSSQEVAQPLDEPLSVDEDAVQPETIVNENLTLESALITTLQESVDNLRSIIVEQQNNQLQLASLISGLMESLDLQNKFIEKRFESVDSQITDSSKVLLEVTERLQELAIREVNLPAPVVNIPAPIVNVSLSEQKRVTKTVDRDANGLITKITEDTEQSVEKDK